MSLRTCKDGRLVAWRGFEEGEGQKLRKFGASMLGEKAARFWTIKILDN
jgi:hypothetical protein